jgi:hypothetical protein
MHRALKFLLPIALLGGALLLSAQHPLRDRGSAASLWLTDDCGAKGDGKADDSSALKACLDRLQSALNAGHPTVLRIPAGHYRITGSNGEMPTIRWRGGTIQGDGPHASYIILDESYRGALFSWSEAWTGRNYGADYDPMKDANGPTITGLQIVGSLRARAVQNAFVFYDRADHVLMRDIEVINLKGQCLSLGRPKFVPVAYVRESFFENLKCWGTGTSSLPAVDIGSHTAPNSDGSNELDFYKLAIFDSASEGLVIRNPNNASATRRIRFFGLRLEKCGGDCVVIGAASDRGQISGIDIFSLTVVQAGASALHVGAGASAPEPYQISVNGGFLGPGNKQGAYIEAARLIELNLSHVDSPILLGPRAKLNVRFSGNGDESSWQIKRLGGPAPH